MKKSILTIAVIASAVACSKTEIVEMAPQAPISFGSTFVDNATRSIDATLNTGTLTEFKVYGSVTWKDQGAAEGGNTVNIFNGVDVKKGGAKQGAVEAEGWWYDGAYTQYWIEGNAYKFAAIVNGTAATFSKDDTADGGKDNMPLTITYNAAGQQDLLYAEDNTITNYNATTNTGVVEFTFDHLLSKVQFTFMNTMTSNTNDIMYTYKVSDIKITNAYMDGTYTIADKTWTVSDTGEKPRAEVAFGNITNAAANAEDTEDSRKAIQVGAVGAEASATSHYSRLLIPNTYTDLKITYTIETLLNGVVIDKDDLTASPASITLEAGHAYNFILSKGNPGEPIKFALKEVNGWDLTNVTDTTIQEL